MAQLTILKAGEKPLILDDIPGDYEDWIAAGMGVDRKRLRVVSIFRGEPFPPYADVAALAITGSAAMVRNGDGWIDVAARWLRGAVELSIPTLGICFGHQLLAYTLGGSVDYNPRGLEVGTATVRLTDAATADPLFSGEPSSFPVQESHRQSVLRLPGGARALAENAHDPHQAIAYGERVWGVQFHPEFDENIARHFVRHFAALLAEQGSDAAAIEERCSSSPESARLLSRFRQLALT